MNSQNTLGAGISEAEFIDAVTAFLHDLRGPEHGAVEADSDLVTDVGLDSIQLIALLGFIERLRDRELDEVPELGGLTIRSAYRALFLGGPGESALRGGAVTTGIA
ncbi:hypothetical protein JK358_28350 [Nocardia sp. 2]|uniref:Acyl carrier protein n=1 Tax=Nocardia acididurans TaxID=2802282 RepID=A0ABS1ME11_9NOCA|nr:hypothetical protein [Nocardia acididurans]MBL1078325.1 hypothetical protein [Nocardia acididurans]